MYKTTKKDFAEFKKEVEYWVIYFGLLDWEPVIIHMMPGIEDATASFNHNSVARHFIIRLATKIEEKPTPIEIKEWAFHEVCHLLLCGLTELAYIHYSNERVTIENHKIVQMLLNTIFKEKRKK